MLQRILAVGLLLVSATLSAQQAPDLNKILADIRARDKGQLAVSEEDGRFLRLMIASTNRKRASKARMPILQLPYPGADRRRRGATRLRLKLPLLE